MCHHLNERAREPVEMIENEEVEALEDEAGSEHDEPTVRTTANADD